MKTKIILLAVFYLAAWGCDKKKIEKPPKDFEVILWESNLGDFGQVELIKGKLTRNVDGTDYKVKLFLTEVEKQAVYNSLLNNGLLDLPENYNPKRDCGGIHQLFFEMKIFANNRVHHIQVSNCDYRFFENLKVKKCFDSIHQIITIVEKRKEVKEIPKSGGLRM